jgi:hypothetical protein
MLALGMAPGHLARERNKRNPVAQIVGCARFGLRLARVPTTQHLGYARGRPLNYNNRLSVRAQRPPVGRKLAVPYV